MKKLLKDFDIFISDAPILFAPDSEQLIEREHALRSIYSKSSTLVGSTAFSDEVASNIRYKFIQTLDSQLNRISHNEWITFFDKVIVLLDFPLADLWIDARNFGWLNIDRLSQIADYIVIGDHADTAKRITTSWLRNRHLKMADWEWIGSDRISTNLPPLVSQIEEKDPAKQIAMAEKARLYFLQSCAQHLVVRETYYPEDRLQAIQEVYRKIELMDDAGKWLGWRFTRDYRQRYRAYQIYDMLGMADYDHLEATVVTQANGSQAIRGTCGICGESLYFVYSKNMHVPAFVECQTPGCGRMSRVVLSY